MALTPVPIIDPGLGDVPDPADDEAVFEADAYDFTSRMPGFGSDIKTIGDATYANAQWAETKAGEAATSASNAATSESNAGLSATAAADSASAANTSAVNALASEVAASKLNLGDFSSPPTTDNQGQPLRINANYYDTTLGKIRSWSGSAWADGISAVAGVTTVNDRNGAVTGLVEKSGDSMTGALNESAALSSASASTVNIGAINSNTIAISGTAGISSFGTSSSGVIRRLVFDGVLTITHNATSLILPGNTNAITSAGDVAEFLSLGGGNWRCVAYQKSSGQALVSSNTAFLNKLVMQSSTTLTIPSGAFKVRGYAGGKGGNGTGGAAPAGAGSGGGFAFGDIAVTPGETITIDITAGVAKVLRGATALLTANPGNDGSTTVDVAGGTASIDGSVTNGAAYSGGVGKRSETTWPGGGSAGSPLGNGYSGGVSGTCGGGGGIGGVGANGFGGGVGGAAAALGPGGAGGPASPVSGSYGPGPGRAIPFADPLLAHCTSAAEFVTASAQFTSVAGPGAGGLPGGSSAGPGGTGGFGGGGGSYNGTNAGQGGAGGELGGGGAGKTIGGTSMACGGGGAGGTTGGTGGPATIWIFY